MPNDTTPRAWVGCLACYNAGRLTGEWIDGTEAADYVPCHRTEYGTPHEEWWVFDHENYGPALRGECSPAEAQRIAELLADEMGPVAAAYADHVGCELAEALEAVTDGGAYLGEFESLEDWAEQWIDDTGMLRNVPEELARYFDTDAWLRDQRGYVGTEPAPGGRVYVFESL